MGTLRSNKFLPKDILRCKLSKDEMVSKEDDNRIVVLKRRDTRDVRISSTKRAAIVVPSRKKIAAFALFLRANRHLQR